VKTRRGRPIKSAVGTKRVQLNILVRADLKRTIALAAKRNDRTLSAEAELWLERLLAYESLMQAFANLQAGPKSLGNQFREAFARLADKGPGEGLRDFTKALAQDGPGDDEDSKS